MLGQTVTFRSQPLAEWHLDNGRKFIGYFDGSQTVGNGWDSVAFGAGIARRCNFAKIAQYDLYTTPISVSTTSTVSCDYLVTDINASAASGNITITLSPIYDKQVINVKRTDNTSNTLTIQMASGTIEGNASWVIDNIQNVNYQLRWDAAANTTSIR